MRNINVLLDHNTGRLGQQIQNFNLNLKTKLLNLEIGITNSDIKRISKQLTIVDEQLNNSLPEIIINEYKRRLNIKYEREFQLTKNRNIRKLENLKSEVFSKIKFQDKWFKNLTDIVIPDEIQQFLSLGPKFSVCPTIKDIRIDSLLADLEDIIDNFNENDKNLYRAQFTNIITNYLHFNNNNIDQLTLIFNKCKMYLKQHPEICIINSDKGNVTVTMYKDDYIRRSQILLDDTKYYKPIRADPSCTLQQKANKIVSELKNKNMIEEITAKKLMIYNSVTPRFYSLPKIHKPVLSMRPIISSINSPNSKITNLLTQILTNAYDNNNPYHVNDSFSFSEFINNFQLPPNYVLISLDVVSLFTNLPLELVKLCIEKKWNSINNFCNIEKLMFMKMIDFIFDSTCLVFNEKFYKQIFGTPMGSSISPIISSYVLDELLDYCTDKITFDIPFLKRYVDDLILSVPENCIDEILNIFNSFDTNIQFTVEKETDQSVPFLDMKLIRTNNNTIITRWYRKPINSNRFINYYSHHPMKMKINLIHNLKNRVKKVTHITLINDCLIELKNILLENSYPKSLINKIIFSSSNIDVPLPINNQISIFKSLPYINELTPKLISLFKNETNIKFAKTNLKTIFHLHTKLKTPVPVKNRSNIIYEIPCSDCDLVYIGQTCRMFKDRITSHKSDCRRNLKSCSLAEHVIDEDHRMNYDSAKVLDNEKHLNKRLFLEMVHINENNKAMNKRTDINELSTIYTFLLKKQKDNKSTRPP